MGTTCAGHLNVQGPGTVPPSGTAQCPCVPGQLVFNCPHGTTFPGDLPNSEGTTKTSEVGAERVGRKDNTEI